ncbi:AraC family transcriptional regulator [Halioglobus maricola]|uniref:AraC family transcriptional regulator n=1 Tax=Halioglobus maricola TaxID=2601894 RepID=A0A5P9NM43_9GAMM|nr:AraC family transcriptional regulator [Halioglobus maricola]QFU76890.1 AraC family transcriptional regulator [Halioglobus maricola]
MPEHEREVSVGLTRALLDTLRLEGESRPECLLDELGIDSAVLERPENRISFDQQEALWGLAVERSGSPVFGLQFARAIQPASFGLMGYMVMNCSTIDGCLDVIVDYQFLAGQGGSFRRTGCDQYPALDYQAVNPGDAVTAHRVIAMFASIVSLGRWLAGGSYGLERLEVCSLPGTDLAPYTEYFECPVISGCDENRLFFAPTVLQLPVTHASEELLNLLTERADRLLSSLSLGPGVAARVAGLLATQLDQALPARKAIASQLGMSERTLQRRLQQEGTTYQQLLDQTRHHLALEMLRNRDVPLADVAAQLGFAEPSAFYRAFRKWQGVTPGDYRQTAGAGL